MQALGKSIQTLPVFKSLTCAASYSTKVPSAKEFIEERDPYVATTYARPNLVFEKGDGCFLWDTDGKKYIDFSAGIAVTALGHANKEVAKIMYEQAQTLVHCSNLFHNLWSGELCKRLIEETKQSNGMSEASRVFLCNSGTEANEAALKFARKHGKTLSEDKTEFVTFETSFHGRSMGALSVTPNAKYQSPFAPLISGVKVAKPNDIASVEAAISDKTCGVIIEPIQGEGGIRPMEREFLYKLRELCTKHKAVLIYDEIQCGLGRSGKLWAHSELPKRAHPDIVTMAKALGNGFPIGATMITEQVESALNVGDHGTTYGGNPLGARIGAYVLDQISNPEFLEKVKQKSEIFKVKLNELKEKYPQQIKEVRGEGLLLGLEFSESPAKIVEIARENGLLIITAGGNVVRFVPCLNIEDSSIYEGLQLLEKSLETAFK